MTKEQRTQLDEWLPTYKHIIEKSRKHVSSIRVSRKILTDEKHENLLKDFDFMLFCALNNLDLVVGLKYLHISLIMNNILEANFFARIISTQIYEHLKDVKSYGGVKIRSNISKENSTLLQLFNTVNKEFSNFMNNENDKLKEIRNNTFAHKEKGGFKQAEIIENIDSPHILKIGEELFSLNMKLVNLFIKYLEREKNYT